MADTRMIAVVVEASGATLEDAVKKALGRLKSYYGDEEPILLHELHPDPVHPRDGLIRVTATGYHKPGEVLLCDRSNTKDVSVPFDAPCIYQPGSGFTIKEPAVPNSVVGMHRGDWVYVLDGDHWVTTKIPARTHIYDQNADYWSHE